MPVDREGVLKFLDELGIESTTVNHPPLFTVEESQALRGEIPGGHTKNLFLKDKKDQVFLVTTLEDAELDLKHIHHRIGASGRVSFGKPELLLELLGVVPGAVTPLGLINDRPPRVRVVLDRELMAHEVVNCHPLVNTATTSLRSGDLLKFIRATGHEPAVLDLRPEPAAEL